MVLRYALIVAMGLVFFAAMPTVYITLRESWLRREARRLAKFLESARSELVGSRGQELPKLLTQLGEHYGPDVLERALLLELEENDPARSGLAKEAFAASGLFEVYNDRVQKSRSWNERAHAAKILGMLGDQRAAAALVVPLRDVYEDVAVKSAAAAALAALRDESVLPVLVQELGIIDEHAAPIVADAVVAFGFPATTHLIPLLDPSHPAATRVWAARLLGRIGHPVATDALIPRLRDRYDLLRIAVAEALGNIGDRRALHDLIQATLRDPAGQVRAHAAAALAQIEKERVVDVLVSALADPDYATRARALEAFETISLQDTHILESALRDPNHEVRKRAALALERAGFLGKVFEQLASFEPRTQQAGYASLIELGRAGLVDSIPAYLNHDSFQVRAFAAQALGELNAKQAAIFLRPAAEDAAWPVRASVATTMGRLRLTDGVPVLVKMLGDDEEPVREAAAEALAVFSAEELDPHIDALARAFERGNATSRHHVALIAARLNHDKLTRVLVEGVTDPSEMVRMAAVSGLAGRKGEGVVEGLVSRLTDPSIEVRLAAVGALGSASTPEAFEGLLRALPEAPPNLRDRIADSLAQGGKDMLLARVDELLKSPDVNVQLGVAWTLGKSQDPAVVPYLAEQLRARDARIRASAAGALAKIDGKASVDALLGAASDLDARTRAAVTNSLGRVGRGDPRVALTLKERLNDPDPFVRDRACVCLSMVAGSEDAVRTIAARAEMLTPVAVTTALVCAGDEGAMKDALTRLSDPAHLEEVQNFLVKQGDVVRSLFFGRLGLEAPANAEKIDSVELVERYAQILRASLDPDARRTAVEALSRMRGVRILQILIDALMTDPQEPVRIRAAEVLAGLLHEEPARNAMIQAIADPIPQVAVTAIRALAKDRDPRVAAVMFGRLGTASPEVREALEETLATMHKIDPHPFFDRMMGVDSPNLLAASLGVLRRLQNPAAIPLLGMLIKSQSAQVRAAAVRAIAELGTPETFELLDRMLDDTDEQVRTHAVIGLCRAKSASLLLQLTRVRRDPSVHVRATLALQLGAFPYAPQSGASRFLEALAVDPSPTVRGRVLGSHIEQGEPEPLRQFESLYAQADVETRHALTVDERMSSLSQRLHAIVRNRPEVELRQLAVIALRALNPPDLDTCLLTALLDPAPPVRIAALSALAVADNDAVRERVRELMRDPDEAVRELAARAIEQMRIG